MDLSSISKFAVINLGCKVNRVESDSFTATLKNIGATLVPLEDAQLVFINTCTVTGEAEKKTRKAVRGALRDAPKATILVTGCASAIHGDRFRAMDSRIEVQDRHELFSRLADLSPSRALRQGKDFNTRVGLKIQDGCNHRCTYCIVSKARGPERSTDFRSVLDEARAYMDAGVKELVLTGINLGAYDHNGKDLCDLLESLQDLSYTRTPSGEIPCRIRASSLEPHSITPRFVDLLAQSDGIICRHLHLPLQSGSSTILKAMNRPYDAREFQRLGELLYLRIPTLSLTTDIICGFPGETEKDFEATLDLARKLRFSKIHVFPYSRREKTPAAQAPNQIAAEVKAARAKTLRDLAETLRREDFERRRGTTELVLVEPTEALSESYHSLILEEDFPVGSLKPYRMR